MEDVNRSQQCPDHPAEGKRLQTAVPRRQKTPMIQATGWRSGRRLTGPMWIDMGLLCSLHGQSRGTRRPSRTQTAHIECRPSFSSRRTSLDGD